MPWHIGLVRNRLCDLWIDSFVRELLGDTWYNPEAIWYPTETPTQPFYIGHTKYSEVTFGALTTCPGVGSMIRTTPIANNHFGQYIAVALNDLYDPYYDPFLNFRVFIEISNFVDTTTGRRRSASILYNSNSGEFLVSTYGIDAGGSQVDYDSVVVTPTIPDPPGVQATFELDSYDDRQIVLLNHTAVLESFPTTDLEESGGYQMIQMWWDVEFGSCDDATSPVITIAAGGELCDACPCITGVMGSELWQAPFDGPMTYDGGGFYWNNLGGLGPQAMFWPTSSSGFQSIEATVTNFGPLEDGGDILALHCRSTDINDSDAGLQLWVRKWVYSGDPFASWDWYVQSDGAVLASAASITTWPYGDISDETTFLLISDPSGIWSVFVNGTLLVNGFNPTQSTGNTQVGWYVERYAAGGIGDSVHVSDICVKVC